MKPANTKKYVNPNVNIFNMFKTIYNRNDNFYLIAYRYFDSLTGKRYD
jgi:hypothetical protein